jgi:hypothetical protein
MDEDARKEMLGADLDGHGAMDNAPPKEIPGLNLDALSKVIEQRFGADTVSLVYLTQGGFHLVRYFQYAAYLALTAFHRFMNVRWPLAVARRYPGSLRGLLSRFSLVTKLLLR